MTNWKACSGDGTQDSGLKPRDPRLLAALLYGVHPDGGYLREALPEERRESRAIKFLLGHSSIQTTERYLGSEQEIVTAVNDNMGL